MKRKFKKLIGVLLVVMASSALFSLTAHAVSLDYSGGSSSNNTGAGPTTSGFLVSYSNTVSNVCGYRFSVVSSSGVPKSGTRVINIYLSDKSEGTNAYSSAHRFIISSGIIANKKQLANGTKVSTTSAKQSCEYKSGDCGFYSTLPQNPNSIGPWIKNTANSYQNLQRIYALCGTNLAYASASDYVLIEPLFRPMLASVRTAATATELAIYGAAVSGGDQYSGTNGNLYNAGSGTLWNICNYVNREFPNALYVSSDTDVYRAVTIKTSSRYIYRDIIQKGYGCSVLTVKNVVTVKTDYTNTIAHWKYVGTGGDNSNGTYKYMGSSTFTGRSGSLVTIPSILIQTYAGYYNSGLAGSYWGTSTWTNKDIGSSFTQPDCNVSMEYYYYPKTVKVIFNKNDGNDEVLDQTFIYDKLGNRFGYNHDGTPKWSNNSGQFGGWDREGYTLLGWSESASATTATYSVYSSVENSWINSKVPDPNASGTVTLYAVWEPIEKIVIVPIEPNAPYREKTKVISSFWLVNISNKDFTPDDQVLVFINVYNSAGQRIFRTDLTVILPKNDKNLVYITWYVPAGSASQNVKITAHIDDGLNQYGAIENIYPVTSFDICKTPDTDYKNKAPTDFSVPSTSFDNDAKARWWQWEYSDGSFVKKQYAVSNTANSLLLTTSTNPTAYFESGKLYMKSGYGFGCSFAPIMSVVSGYDYDSVNKCVAPQYFYALFPEYNYAYGTNKCRSFETVSGKKVFVSATGMERQHFTPIYYPDGKYDFQIVLSDCWTPAGMLTTYKTVTIQIDGNIYDDWYIKH